MKLLFCLIIAFPFFCSADYTSDLFALNSKKAEKLFTSVNTSVDKDGVSTIVTTYFDLSGKPVFKESSEIKGTILVKTDIEQLQMNAKATIEIKDGKILFSKSEGGKTKTEEEKLKGDLVISTNFQRYVNSKWAELNSGKDVSIRWGSWDRMETVGFDLKKMGTEKVDGEELTVIRMKPSSFIIAAIVSPITFRFAADGTQLRSMSGRVQPKITKDGQLKDLDADVFYTYKK